jgi:hypothetical protein
MPVPVRPLGSQGLHASAQGLGCMGECTQFAARTGLDLDKFIHWRDDGVFGKIKPCSQSQCCWVLPSLLLVCDMHLPAALLVTHLRHVSGIWRQSERP